MGKGEIFMPGRPDVGTRRVTVSRVNPSQLEPLKEPELVVAANDPDMSSFEKLGLLLSALAVVYNQMQKEAIEAAQMMQGIKRGKTHGG